MTGFDYLIIAAIAFLIITALLHSIAGEHFLIKPMLKYRGNRVLENDLARLVLRFAWHLTSILWFLLAAILYLLAFDIEKLNSGILVYTGIAFVGIGVFDLIASRGRHIGWPSLLAVGICTLSASFLLKG
ncbi:hypothetical protein [Pseudoteredinibacter isoporae]|uniref:Uncharacterized protein n=1 Tax=Pseudoteredinibacter isoporae TaxID=570281 RepID=A0A7X0MX55_9GAMM|nr:hypothetical protein [Pseudoteredinibacter isoporae]MBB6523128.1 hypothetical protein [Pseudoteredinibacter isoporae]NHO88648.1 hypothetical protein [Pseudoteredinibacter isoporae]NIB22661.1 hypothetical protein [Pseudoteredinibacter isoporae]